MVTSNNRVRIPPITDISTAIRKYYERAELDNKDIQEIFGKHSSATICKLKRLARQEMLDRNTLVWSDNRVNTRDAYTAWGLDIHDLESRYRKLKEFSA